MNKMIDLTIDNREITVQEGTTILEAAKALDIPIPTICYHEACTSNAVCRMCVVEIERWRVLAPSCAVEVTQGMRVTTHSPRLERTRRTILEMLASTVDLSAAPEITALMAEYGADPRRFPDAKRRQVPVLDDNPMFIRDYSKCILCWRCVQVCAEDAQYTYAINFTGRGFDTSIGTFFDKPLPETTCVFCGQCVAVCPSGALIPKREWLLEQGLSPTKLGAMPRMGKKRDRSGGTHASA